MLSTKRRAACGGLRAAAHRRGAGSVNPQRGPVVDGGEWLCGTRLSASGQFLPHRRWHEVGHRLALHRYERIEGDRMPDSVGARAKHARNDTTIIEWRGLPNMVTLPLA